MAPRDGRERALGVYLACSAAVHVAAFASSSLLQSTREVGEAGTAAPVVHASAVDVEPATDDSPAAPPGAGSAIPGEWNAATAPASVPPWTRNAPAVFIALARGGASRLSRSTESVSDPSGGDGASSRFALQASDERRRRDMARAAAAASAGEGPGATNGSAGNGVTAIRGKIAFGNGIHGALTGRVCFLPVGTSRIADVLNCRYVATVYTDTLDIPERQFSDGFPGVTSRSEWFLIDYSGTFSVTGYGTYVFRLHSDDGSYLYIDDTLVIDNDGKHAPESRSGSVQLAVGEHRIKVRYAQTDDRMALQLFVRPPQGPEEVFTTHL